MADVSPAFAQTPQNPNLVAQNRQETQEPQQQPQPAIDQQQERIDYWRNQVNAPAPQAQTAPDLPADTTPPQTQIAQPQPQVAQQPQVLPEQNIQFAQLQQQNATLQQQIQQQNEVIKNLIESQKGYDDLKAQSDLNNISFGDLQTIDEGDAKAIANGIIKALGPQLDSVRQALKQQEEYTQKSNQWQEQRFAQQQARDTIAKIMTRHPDFLQLQSDPNYLRFVQQRDGYSSQTYDVRAAYEFQNGNADYIIDMIDRYKNSIPTKEAITSVAPVQTAANQSVPADAKTKLPTLRELNNWMQMRQITQDEYRQLLQQVMAAQQ